MKSSSVLRGLAVVLIIATNFSHAQPAGFAVTQRGADWRVLSKTTVVNGTNRTSQYTELATGLNYQNSYGQWTESKEQITLLPSGGASATEGQHRVYFPANLYNGVLEVVTPDGKHLKSRPLGVSYDDGSNTVFIATLKSAQGYLTSANTVTYRDAFTGFKADLVCQYRRGGFESDLVFRQQPLAPQDFGLNPDSATLQLVTEFFNTQDPQQIPSVEDQDYGLQDMTLRFGSLLMVQGKAFATKTGDANSPAQTPEEVPVYKTWLNLAGRKFLIEEVPLADIADNLDALPLTASVKPPRPGLMMMASGNRQFPPSHEMVANTNQMQLATADFSREPGVVLDYQSIITSQTNFTFYGDTTYYLSGSLTLMGTNTFEGGAILKYATNAAITLIPTMYPIAIKWQGSADHPVVFTAKDDDSVGQTISGSTGNPSGYYANPALKLTGVPSSVISNFCIAFAKQAIYYSGNSATFSDGKIVNCLNGFTVNGASPIKLRNVLFSNVSTNFNNLFSGQFDLQNCTFSGSAYLMTIANAAYQSSGLNLTNCILVNVTNSQTVGPSPGSYYLNGNFNGFHNSFTFGGNRVTNVAYPFQTAGAACCYLATNNPFRDAGTTAIHSNLLASLQTLTTFAPQDGGYADTNTPDLGYHYPVNEDSDHDGLPDWWEWKWFGGYTNSGISDYDGDGVSNGDEYANHTDPNEIGFTMRLGNQHFNTTNATGTFLVLSGVPSYAAVLVNATNLNNAVWQPYDGIVRMNLGATDGVYQVWLGLKGRAEDSKPTWIGTAVTLTRTLPQLFITSPTNNVVGQPYLQLQGHSSLPLASICYDVSNAVAVVTNQLGSITGHTLDTNLLAYTADYFQCYDIPLADGFNRITVHATDPAGNLTTTNIVVTLNYAAATNPVIQLTWPKDGSELVCDSFTLRGWTEDATARITAQIVNTNGQTNVVSGLVERTGVLWVRNLPLAAGTNYLTLWVTNAAGYSSMTNISLVKGSLVLTMNPVTDSLWLPKVTVTGFVSDDTQAVWVNGVKATVTTNGDGTAHWLAHDVPVSSGGVASFDMTAYPPEEAQPDGSHGNQ